MNLFSAFTHLLAFALGAVSVKVVPLFGDWIARKIGPDA